MFKYTLNTGNVVGSKSTSFSSSCPAADSPAGAFSALIGSVEVDMDVASWPDYYGTPSAKPGGFRAITSIASAPIQSGPLTFGALT
jgi:hypothetical protein